MELTMSTTAQVTETPNLDLSIKTENLVYQVWVKTDEKGAVIEKEITYRAVGSDEAKEKEATEKLTSSGYILGKQQTVKSYKAGTMEGFLEIVSDPDEALNIANRGLAAKFNQKIKDVLTDFDTASQTFVNPQTEDVFDSRELLQEPTQRRALNQSEKIIRDLKKSGLSDTVIAAMIQTLQASMLAS